PVPLPVRSPHCSTLMPSVTRRWHGEPFQNPLRDRNIALDTACGAFAPSSLMMIFPQLVARVRSQLLWAARVFGGAVFQDFGVAGGFPLGAGQGLAPAAPADADGEAALADATGADAEGVGLAAVVPEPVLRSNAAPMAIPITT